MRPWKKRLLGESGQSTIIIAVAVVVLCGFAAFVTDVGIISVDKGQLQTAADAAALAGGYDLPSVSAATQTAKQYAGLNGVDATDVTVNTPYNGDANKIEVICSRTIEYKFARIFGLTSTTATSRAVAEKTGMSGGAFGYALFSGSQNTALGLNSSNLYIAGSAHTNSSFYINGSNQTFTGSTEAVSDFTVNASSATVGGICQGSTITLRGGNINIPNLVYSAAAVIDMPDFADSARAEAQASGNIYSGYTNFYGSQITVDSSIYVDGDVNISGSSFTGQGIILATGNIMLSGSNLENTGSAVCFYSENGYIMLNGSNIELDGIIYAPHGSVYINGANVIIHGRIVAEKVYLNGSNIDIISGSHDLDCLPGSSVKLVE